MACGRKKHSLPWWRNHLGYYYTLCFRPQYFCQFLCANKRYRMEDHCVFALFCKPDELRARSIGPDHDYRFGIRTADQVNSLLYVYTSANIGSFGHRLQPVLLEGDLRTGKAVESEFIILVENRHTGYAHVLE